MSVGMGSHLLQGAMGYHQQFVAHFARLDNLFASRIFSEIKLGAVHHLRQVVEAHALK